MIANKQENVPPTGLYRCIRPKWDYAKRQMTFDFGAGEFTLLADGKYKAWPNDPRIGEYSFHPDTKLIKWLNGPFAEGGAYAKYSGLNSDGYTIVLCWPVGNRISELWCYRKP
jgi:hypothetical protein